MELMDQQNVLAVRDILVELVKFRSVIQIRAQMEEHAPLDQMGRLYVIANLDTSEKTVL